jgi:membrane-associated phospholipid phosphatase
MLARHLLMSLSLALTVPVPDLSAQIILVAPAAALDREAYMFAMEHQSRGLDKAADAVGPLGRARYLVPAMASAYLTARIAGNRRWSDALVRIAAGYAAADMIGSLLKPGVGRHRPDSLRRPWRFRPFNAQGEWHSFTSAHAVHAFALATGIAEEADNPWVSAGSYLVASAVGLQRVYTGSHWLSDVTASALLAIGVSKATNAWLRERQTEQAGGRPWHLVMHPGGVAVRILSPR